MAEQRIHLVKAALDEVATERGNQIVLRGVLDKASLEHLKVDEYQREALPLSALTRLWEALKNRESLPDIELGMRGTDFDVEGRNESEFWLKGDVYIIDGQQRRNAALHILTIMPDLDVRLGCMVHFGTTREWERERFKILNLDRAKVSPNVLLRNMRHQSAAVLTLYGLCHNDPTFALFERVCWRQASRAQDLITARTLASTVAALHAHRTAAFRNSLGELVPALDRQAAFVRLNQWRENVKYFFDFLDEAWGVRDVTFRDLALQCRAGFLVQLTLLLSDHCNFWRGERETVLYIDADWRKAFGRFPMHDPTVIQLIHTSGGAGGGKQSVLYSLLRDHLNKGRSANRLVNRREKLAEEGPRRFAEEAPAEDDFEDVEYPGNGRS